MDTWRLKTNVLEPYYFSYLGNGYLGIQTSKDGTGAYFKARSFIAGVYDGEYEKIVEIPKWSGILFSASDYHPFSDLSKIKNYKQILDLKKAVLLTKYTWLSPQGSVDFDIEFFVSRADPHVAAISYVFTPRQNIQAVLETFLDASGLENLRVIERGAEENTIWLEVETSLSKIRIAEVSKVICEPEPSAVKEVIEEKSSRLKLVFEAEENKSYCVRKYTVFYTTLDSEKPLENALRKAEECGAKGYEKLFDDHCKEWEKIWERDIEVDDPIIQRRIRACVYHLVSSVREGQDHSIPPMGLSNDGWGGHIFWDADFFMFPALILLYPELAKSIVAYRCRTLEAAKEHARKHGYDGAWYGWQTASSGKEVSRGGYSDEIHIVGDVAWAQWLYYLATGDEKYFRECAAPIIIETAKFWASRVVYNAKKDCYEILKVVPPDESVCEKWGKTVVDNSAFTNAIAQWNIKTAIKVCERLGIKYPEKWIEIAEKMYIPFDEEKKIILEYDGYDGHIIKQPDVLEMIFPLEHPMPREVAENNFKYYIDKPDRELGHSFCPSIHVVVACRLGKRKEASEIFKKWDPFFLPPFEVVREILYHDKGIVFLTGVAGYLMNIIYGFAGIKVTEKGLKIKPLLPENISRIIFKKLFFRGKTYKLIVEKRNGRDVYELQELK